MSGIGSLPPPQPEITKRIADNGKNLRNIRYLPSAMLQSVPQSRVMSARH